MLDAKDSASTRPYLIRALFEWCVDNGLTPYVAVMVDDSVRVPMEYVKDGEIVLNISYDATSALKLGNEYIEFKARFAGTAREIMVPVHRVVAIYARENGQGMAFPMGQPGQSANESAPLSAGVQVTPTPPGAEPAKGPKLVAGPTPETPPTDPKPPHGPSGAPGGGGRPALKRIK
ncbi:MAG: putative Stringent starvation protein [Pseudomonadota bacterium]|jgi:stringent starvation protein B